MKINSKLLLSFFILIFLFLSQINAKPYEPQAKGGFKSCKFFKYKIKLGKTDKKSEFLFAETTFDDKGNAIDMITYDEENKTPNKLTITNKYNDKGLLIEFVYHNEQTKINYKFGYVFDERNNKTEDLNYTKEGVLEIRTKYKYDDNNFLVRAEYYSVTDGKEEFTNANKYENDKYGNPLKEINVQPDGSSMTVTYVYKYDKKGRVIRSERTSFDNYKFIKEYKYDDFDNIIEEIYIGDDGKPAAKNVMIYKK